MPSGMERLPSSNRPSVQENARGDLTGTHRKITLLILATVNLAVGINYAILAPFFPLEASKKGVSTSLVGFIFGEFELIIFLTSPIFGILLPRMGAKFMYISGLFLTGSCSILFGVLEYCLPGTPFIITTLAVRGVMAVGASMEVTASFAIIASSFPESVTAMFGLLETFNGLGLMIGPPIGGALFQGGGFIAPFATMGCLILVTVPVTVFFLKFDSSSLPSKTGSFITILRNPHILLAGMILCGTSITIGFIDPVLQKFLSKEFDLNQLMVGLVFVCGPAIYAVLSPIVGHICDKKPVSKQLMPLSLLMIGFSMLLLNPSPVLNLGPPKLWLSIISLILFGLGCGISFTPATKDVLTETLIMGYQDNFGTFSLISGFINACLSLGFFTGPIVSGLITDRSGFPWSTTYIGFTMFGLGVLFGFYMIIFMYCCGGRHRVVPQEEALEPGERQLLVTA